jgi:hypothetical protein
LQVIAIARAEQEALAERAMAGQLTHHPPGLLRHRSAVVDQSHIRPEQFAQLSLGKRVMGATKHQSVDLASF